ncbi:MAG: cytochrome c5 family protein [Lautropia sp.]
MAAMNPAAKANPPAPHGPTPGHSLGGGHGGDDAHESAIKTPRQLITVVVLAFVVPVLVIIMLAVFVAQGLRSGAGSGAMTPEAIEARIKPVAGFELRAAGAAAASRSGEAVYQAVCSACHATGAAGAPKFGDNAAWAPRLQQGLEALVASALKGKGAMPPQGASASELEVARAVVYLSNAAGAKFEEPKAPAEPAK